MPKKYKPVKPPKLRANGGSPIKRGLLSEDDKKLIFKMNEDGLPEAEIARQLNRAESQIHRVLNLMDVNGEIPEADLVPELTEVDFVRELKSRTEWKFIKTNYNPLELEMYLDIYCKARSQFNDNVQFTEDIQILTLCDCIINKYRHAKIRKSAEDEIFRLTQEINQLRLEDPTGENVRLRGLIAARQLQENQSTNRTKELESLESQQNNILKALKATREQRIKNIESSKETFVGLIKLLQDRKVRDKEGRHAELRRIAAKKAREELVKPHQYMDGVYDQPLLSYEDIRIDDENLSLENTSAVELESNEED